MKFPIRIILSAAATALSLRLAPAQPPAANPAASAGVVTLERFEVTGLPVEDSVNPLVRPVEGVFGDARSLLETPRSVSTITQALLRERGINGVAELVAYAPGSSTVELW